MRPILPLILLVILFGMTACSAPQPMTSASAAMENGNGPKTLMVREQATELGDKPVTVTLPVGNAKFDPRRTLVLRVEGITVTEPPGIVYELLFGDAAEPAGVLSLYGAEESQGTFVAAVPVDETAAKALKNGARALRITFRPRGVTDANGREVIELKGRPRFSRLRVVAE